VSELTSRVRFRSETKIDHCSFEGGRTVPYSEGRLMDPATLLDLIDYVTEAPGPDHALSLSWLMPERRPL